MNGMSTIVKTITRFVGGMIFLFGIYLILHGHLTPGGGFAGGVVVASALILLTLAYGKEISLKKFSLNAASILESLGALLFLGVALWGFTKAGFFVNFLPKGEPFKFLSAGTIPIYNIGIGLKVAAALFAAFMTLVIFRLPGEK